MVKMLMMLGIANKVFTALSPNRNTPYNELEHFFKLVEIRRAEGWTPPDRIKDVPLKEAIYILQNKVEK